MKKNKFFLILSVVIPFFVFSQQWHTYSDSIISNISIKYNIEKATYFLDLAEFEISKSKIIKDTVYADFLYRKGLVNYFKSKKSNDFFQESLSIWDTSKKKNYYKIMKIHYFLGRHYYYNLLDVENGYMHYEKCYLMNKINNIPINKNFSDSLYELAYIDYYFNLNFNNSKKYAQEYIYYNKDKAILNFDFQYLFAHQFIEDTLGFEKTLLDFEKKYEENELNNINLYHKIINELLMFYHGKSNSKSVIKYGEKSLEIYDPKIVTRKEFLFDVYEMLFNAYSDVNDSINANKYKKFLKNE